jgi:hypothetical protein
LDIVEHIRSNAKAGLIGFRRRVHVLKARHYAKFYSILFLVVVVVQLAIAGLVYADAGIDYFNDLSTLKKVLYVGFAVFMLMFLIASAVFVLVSGKQSRGS